jgi:hypothetical protein
MQRSRSSWVTVAGIVFSLLAVACALYAHAEPTVEELKRQLENTDVKSRPPLCIRISERQLDAAEKSYAEGDNEKAKAALSDVVSFAELARDYAIQSHKHEKQAEIALRKAARRLSDFKHSVSLEDQAPVQSAIERLQRIRDDLLLSMFPKGGHK